MRAIKRSIRSCKFVWPLTWHLILYSRLYCTLAIVHYVDSTVAMHYVQYSCYTIWTVQLQWNMARSVAMHYDQYSCHALCSVQLPWKCFHAICSVQNSSTTVPVQLQCNDGTMSYAYTRPKAVLWVGQKGQPESMCRNHTVTDDLVRTTHNLKSGKT